MHLKCERCGAPLEVPAGGSVRCFYCGTTTAAPAPPAPVMPPGHGYGGPGMHPPQPPLPVAKPQHRQHGVGLWLVGTILTLMISFSAGIIPRLLNSAGSPALQKALNEVGGGKLPALPTALSIPGLGSWSAADPGCLIDANGDGVFDIAGLTGEREPNQATVVDGSSGKVLFMAPAVGKAVQLGCLGESGFFVTEGNFQLDFFTARSPWGKTAVMARDKVDAYGVGQGCVQLRTDDGTTMGVQLPSGVTTTCSVPNLRRYYGRDEPGLMGLTDKRTELSFGARKYSMTVRPSGTEILTVHVTEGPKQIWSKELPYATCTFGAAIAVGPGRILLWAAQPSERSKGLLIGLDEATGNQAFEIAIPDTSSDSPDFFKFNGKYVLAVNWGALRAYELATGAEAWRVGR
ncbi:MAG TPA: hypothetical protein VFK05_20565 [Polyangiaceae bacterium]|nr:hypothetical protein [Polyangiaceae bacterium]